MNLMISMEFDKYNSYLKINWSIACYLSDKYFEIVEIGMWHILGTNFFTVFLFNSALAFSFDCNLRICSYTFFSTIANFMYLKTMECVSLKMCYSD